MKTKLEREYTYGCVEMMFLKVQFECGPGGCLTERQKEFVPSRRTKGGEKTRDGEKTRANSIKFGSWDSEDDSIWRRAECALQ